MKDSVREQCPRCLGNGRLYEHVQDDIGFPCWDCKGTGHTAPTPEREAPPSGDAEGLSGAVKFWESLYGQHDPHSCTFMGVVEFAEAYAAHVCAERDKALKEALSLLEPASEWMSQDELEWWERYNRLQALSKAQERK